LDSAKGCIGSQSLSCYSKQVAQAEISTTCHRSGQNANFSGTGSWVEAYHMCMTSTQRSEGMNNVFKKIFCRKLGLSELLVECDRVSKSLREKELDENFKSHIKKPVIYTPNLPLLKTVAESYTRIMYKEFEEEFKMQFSYSCQLL
jgi:hypothetical protein